MAKIKLSALLQSVSGKVGDTVFVRTKHGILVRKAPKKTVIKTEKAAQIKKIMAELVPEWKKFTMEVIALWETYAKVIGKKDGRTVFLGTNVRLIDAGLPMITIPPITKSAPPGIQTDLVQYGKYKEKIDFYIWLPQTYQDKCVAQIWVRKLGNPNWQLPIRPAPIVKFEEKTKITIDRIRIRKENEQKEVYLKEIAPLQIYIQMNTLAENGRISCPSPKYKIQIIP